MPETENVKTSFNITINGTEIQARQGESLLNCALRNGIDIPHLCNHPALPPFGACRLCLVEVEGMRGFPASCTTPAAEGMVVNTETDKLNELRKNVLELIITEHPNACLICDKRELCEKYRPESDRTGRTTGCHTCPNKDVCDVRKLSERFGVEEISVAPFYRHVKPSHSDPFIDLDMNLCILCGQCVRICKLYHETATIDFVNRGSRTVVGTAFDKTLLDAGCRFCGACVDVCPTGSLMDRYAKWYGSPDSETTTTCSLCPESCSMEALSIRGYVRSTRSASENAPLCVLGRFAYAPLLNSDARLAAPLVRTEGRLHPVPFEEAVNAAADILKPLVGTGKFAFVCDASSTLEDRYVFRKFTKEVMGAKNYIELRADESGRISPAQLPEAVTAVFTTGPFLEDSDLEGLDAIITADFLPSPVSDSSAVVFPSAILAEISGTIEDATGKPRPLAEAAEPREKAEPDWWTVSAIAAHLGYEALDYADAAAIRAEAGISAGEFRNDLENLPAPAEDPALRRLFYRGHELEKFVGGLKNLAERERD